MNPIKILLGRSRFSISLIYKLSSGLLNDQHIPLININSSLLFTVYFSQYYYYSRIPMVWPDHGLPYFILLCLSRNLTYILHFHTLYLSFDCLYSSKSILTLSSFSFDLFFFISSNSPLTSSHLLYNPSDLRFSQIFYGTSGFFHTKPFLGTSLGRFGEVSN